MSGAQFEQQKRDAMQKLQDAKDELKRLRVSEAQQRQQLRILKRAEKQAYYQSCAIRLVDAVRKGANSIGAVQRLTGMSRSVVFRAWECLPEKRSKAIERLWEKQYEDHTFSGRTLREDYDEAVHKLQFYKDDA